MVTLVEKHKANTPPPTPTAFPQKKKKKKEAEKRVVSLRRKSASQDGSV